MDVANISATAAQRLAGQTREEPVAPRAAHGEKSVTGEDRFAASAASQTVADRVAELRATSSSEVREDLVLKFRALMGSGALDTPERAAAAADAMLRA
jgi:hypothetical protein